MCSLRAVCSSDRMLGSSGCFAHAMALPQSSRILISKRVMITRGGFRTVRYRAELCLYRFCCIHRSGRGRSGRLGRWRSFIIDRQGILSTKNYGSLDDILQFTNIAWPIIELAKVECVLVDFADSLSRLLCAPLYEVLDQHRNVFSTGS